MNRKTASILKLVGIEKRLSKEPFSIENLRKKKEIGKRGTGDGGVI